MTFIASAGNATAIAFATDELVDDGAGNLVPDRKLFILDRRLCVASWEGPGDLPMRMDAVQIGNQNVHQTAEHLATVFGALGVNFGLYVAGVEAGSTVLIHVHFCDSGSGLRMIVRDRRDPTGICAQVAPKGFPLPADWCMPNPVGAAPDELVLAAEDRVRQAAALDGRVQGLQSVLVTAAGAEWRTR